MGSPQSEKRTNEYSCRVKISFISIGTGINAPAKKELGSFLENYQQDHQINLGYQVQPWGREGEVDYCFPLAALDPSGQDKFIRNLREVFEEKDRVLIKTY